MAHVPEDTTEYVCENCQITHAGTPIHLEAGKHTFEPPEICGGCGETVFIEMQDWIHHHKEL